MTCSLDIVANIAQTLGHLAWHLVHGMLNFCSASSLPMPVD